MTVIPMTSARIEPGLYLVLGTSSYVAVVKREGGWKLLGHDDRPVSPSLFPTKRAALVYCQEHPEL